MSRCRSSPGSDISSRRIARGGSRRGNRWRPCRHTRWITVTGRCRTLRRGRCARRWPDRSRQSCGRSDRGAARMSATHLEDSRTTNASWLLPQPTCGGPVTRCRLVDVPGRRQNPEALIGNWRRRSTAYTAAAITAGLAPGSSPVGRRSTASAGHAETYRHQRGACRWRTGHGNLILDTILEAFVSDRTRPGGRRPVGMVAWPGVQHDG